MHPQELCVPQTTHTHPGVHPSPLCSHRTPFPFVLSNPAQCHFLRRDSSFAGSFGAARFSQGLSTPPQASPLGCCRLCPDQLTWRGVCLSLKIKIAPYEQVPPGTQCPTASHRLPQGSDIHSECNPPCHQPGHHCTSSWKGACLNTTPATTVQAHVSRTQ